MSTRTDVAELLARGVPRHEIARRLGVSRPTVTYHAQRLGYGTRPRTEKHHDWAAIQRHYDRGVGAVACIEHFGLSTASWYHAIRRGDLVVRPRAMPIDELLARSRNRVHLRARPVAAGLKEDRCERCGLDEWRGVPLPLQLHHVNGIGEDNRLENLQVLCPNCHVQTDNWGARNKAARTRPDRDAA